MGLGGGALVGLLFPGQGSQFVGMGRDLADAYPAARETFEEADSVLDTALSRICWEGPEEELTATHNAQPAILTHSSRADAMGDGVARVTRLTEREIEPL